MKIIGVEPSLVERYLFLNIHTDAGITGLGESGAWGYLEASKSAIDTFRRYLIGQDPLLREHHFQYMYRICTAGRTSGRAAVPSHVPCRERKLFSVNAKRLFRLQE